DRETLGRSEKGRCRESVIVDVRLIRIVSALRNRDATEIVVEELGQIQRLLTLQLIGGGRLHIGRDLLQRQPYTGQRRCPDHHHLRLLLQGGRVGRRGVRSSVLSRGREGDYGADDGGDRVGGQARVILVRHPRFPGLGTPHHHCF